MRGVFGGQQGGWWAAVESGLGGECGFADELRKGGRVWTKQVFIARVSILDSILGEMGSSSVENRLRGKCGSCETIGAIAIVQAGMVVAGPREVVAEMKDMAGFWISLEDGAENIC